MSGRILITPRSLTAEPPAALALLAREGFTPVFATPGKMPDEAELLALVPGCVGWLAGVEPVSEAVIAAATQLRAISRNGVGVDNLPMPLLHSRGIAVLRAEGGNAVGVAELAIGLALAALRHIPRTDAGVRSGGWPRHRGLEIAGRRVGVVGCGAIGGRVARIFAAMGADVTGFDPAQPDLGIAPGSFRFAPLEEVFARAELLSLHCPPPRDGSTLVDAARLAAMPRGAVIVNTARGSLIDEAAVLTALESGQLAGYAADVFHSEPPGDIPLLRHPHTVFTSHIGGFTDESVDRATEIAVRNLLAALAPVQEGARGG